MAIFIQYILLIIMKFLKYREFNFKIMTKDINVAIVGLGNCASALVQGVEFYKNAKNEEFVPGHNKKNSLEESQSSLISLTESILEFFTHT